MTFLKYDIFTRETVKLSPLFITLKKKMFNYLPTYMYRACISMCLFGINKLQNLSLYFTTETNHTEQHFDFHPLNGICPLHLLLKGATSSIDMTMHMYACTWTHAHGSH